MLRRPRSTVLLGLAAPLLLGQSLPSGCFLGGGGGGGGTPLFNLPPTVVLTTDVQRGVAPLKVFFSSSASTDDGVIVQRQWDFGDGVGTSQEISPTYTYTRTGQYTVKLTLTDDRGATASDTVRIDVTERPVAIIEVDSTTAETAPATFNFDGSKSYDPDAKTGETLRYRWDFGDGSRELLATVRHTFATSGTYRVRLTVTDVVGITGTAEVVIQVGIPRPSISFRAPPSDVTNIVCTNSRNSAVWVHAVYNVAPGVPFQLRAGLDGDRDACNAQVALFDAQTGAAGRELVDLSSNFDLRQGPPRAAVYHPDRDQIRVLVGGDDGIVRLYDSESGVLLRRYTGTGSAVNGLAFRPGGAQFVVGYNDGTVYLRDTANAAILRSYVGHTAAVNAVAVSPDGAFVLTGDAAGQAILWNRASGAEVLRFDHGGAAVTAVAFSPTNPQRVLTASADRTARLWSTVNGNLTQEFAPVYSGTQLVAGHTGAVQAAAFSPDGTQVVTAGADKRVILWSAEFGTQLRVFNKHTDAVGAVAFSPDGTRLLSGSDDGTAIVWNVSTGAVVRTLEPCRSPVVAVGYSPDGAGMLAAVAARNEIQLDTNPASGNDLNLTLPTALRLATDTYEVPVATGGTLYNLWIEIQTDRTKPVRAYAPARVNVLPAFTTTIGPDTPVIPLRSNAANVVVPETTSRQIFDLGAVDVGDRIYLSVLTVPGYGKAYQHSDFSVLLLDANQNLFAWYESDTVLFSPATKLLVGHSSPNMYVVLDAHGDNLVPGVNVSIARQFADDSGPRRQHVRLYFNTTTVQNLTIGGSAKFVLPPFDTEVTAAGFDPAIVRTAAQARVAALFNAYDVVVSTNPPTTAGTPYITIYFDTTDAMLGARIPDRNGDGVIDADDLQFYGVTNYIDARNATLSGRAVISVSQIIADYPGITDSDLGLAIGNAVAHHVGLLSGLRETEQAVPDDIMTNDPTQVTTAALSFTTAPLAGSRDLDPIGNQNAPLLLLELFGPK